MLSGMLPPADRPRLEELPDEELLRALHIEPAFIPDPSAWCAKWRELSVRYRADAISGPDLATYWEEWRQLMRPFKRPTHYRPADHLHRMAGGMLSE